MDNNAISVRDYQIRLFRTLAGLLALWCIFFLMILVIYYQFDLGFLWRISSLGPHRVDVRPVSALAWEWVFSDESEKIILGLCAETIAWIILLAISYVKPNVSCYFGLAMGVVGAIVIIFYFINSEIPYPPYYVRQSLDHIDIMIYVAKRSAAFWLACSPKVFLLAVLIEDSYKLYRHDETDGILTLPRWRWDFSTLFSISFIGAPLLMMALLLVSHVAVSVYENYYPPRVAELAKFATRMQAKRAKQRAEAPRLIAKSNECMCALTGGLVGELRTLYLAYNPKRHDSSKRKDYEQMLRLSFKGTFDGWAQHCTGYFTDPKSWKKAKYFDEVQAVKMSNKELCADKNILFYTLNPPPQAVKRYRYLGPILPAPPKDDAEAEADQVAREAVRAWYNREWHQTCSK